MFYFQRQYQWRWRLLFGTRYYHVLCNLSLDTITSWMTTLTVLLHSTSILLKIMITIWNSTLWHVVQLEFRYYHLLNDDFKSSATAFHIPRFGASVVGLNPRGSTIFQAFIQQVVVFLYSDWTTHVWIDSTLSISVVFTKLWATNTFEYICSFHNSQNARLL